MDAGVAQRVTVPNRHAVRVRAVVLLEPSPLPARHESSAPREVAKCTEQQRSSSFRERSLGSRRRSRSSFRERRASEARYDAGEIDPLASDERELHDAIAALNAEPGRGSLVPSTPGFVRACLRAKKHNVDKAFLLARNYEDFRQRVGWTPGSVTAAALHDELGSAFNLLLPHPDAEGHVVLTQSMRKMASLQSLERMQRAGYYLLHRALERAGAQERGLALLLDFDGFSFRHLRAVGTADIKRGVTMLQDCFPGKLAVIYTLHEPRWLLLVVQLLRPLLSRESMQKKFLLCGTGGARLHAHVPAATLPASLVGLGGTLELDWDAQLRQWEEEEARLPAGWDLVRLMGPAGRECGAG
tara:strand:- start:741 stop:1811 length:1071 start_codon:yes stop_codon:yes gene_type:complete